MDLLCEDKHDIGIPVIDSSHKKILADMAIIYNDSSNNQLGYVPFNGFLDRIMVLYEVRFQEEEQLMDEISYPDAIMHKLSHRILLSNIDKLKTVNISRNSDNIMHDYVTVRDNFIAHVSNESLDITFLFKL